MDYTTNWTILTIDETNKLTDYLKRWIFKQIIYIAFSEIIFTVRGGKFFRVLKIVVKNFNFLINGAYTFNMQYLYLGLKQKLEIHLKNTKEAFTCLTAWIIAAVYKQLQLNTTDDDYAVIL